MKIKKKKGYSLILVITIFTVLVIVGTALLSFTAMNYKKRKAESVLTKTKYYSEAGLDEAYAIMLRYVDNGMKQGEEKVIDKTDELIKAIQAEISKGLQSQVPGSTVVLNRVFTDNNNNVKQDVVDNEKKEAFTSAYKQYIKDNVTKMQDDINGLVRGVKKKESESLIDISNEEIGDTTKIKKPELIATSETDFNSNNELKVDVKSTFVHDNMDKAHDGNFTKTIQASFVIKVPDYMKKAHTAKTDVTIRKNPIWNKALSAESNIIIENGTLNVEKGDVFAGGTTEDDDKYRGITLKDLNSKLTMSNGSAITPENFNVAYNRPSASKIEEKNANVNINNGNIYAKNMLIQDNSVGAFLKMKSAFVLDDLEINAEKTTVNLTGDYYGLQDGSLLAGSQSISKGKYNTTNKPSSSSSIVINANDVGKTDGTNLNIAGKAYIYGSSYVALNDDYKYQTGESISVNGYYKSYTEGLTSDCIISQGRNKNLKDDLEFDYFSPLNVVSSYKEPDVVILGDTSNKTKVKVYAPNMNLLGTINCRIVDKNNNIGSGNVGDEIQLSSHFNEGDEIDIKLSAGTTTKYEGKVRLRGKIKAEIKGAVTAEGKTKVMVDLTESAQMDNEYNGAYKYKLIANGKTTAIYLGEATDINSSLLEGSKIRVTLCDINNNEIQNLSNQEVTLFKKSVPTIYEKSEYFKKYAEEKPNSPYLNLSNINNGISIGNVPDSFHLGAIFTKDSINAKSVISAGNYVDCLSSNTKDASIDDKITSRIVELKDKIYYMDYAEDAFAGKDDTASIENESVVTTSDKVKYQEVANSILSKFSVNNCINTNISNVTKLGVFADDSCFNESQDVNHVINYGLKSEYNNKFYFICKERPVVIVGNNSKASDINNLPNDYIRVNINNSCSGIIVSEADIYMIGDLDIKGSIISKGNIHIRNTDNINKVKVSYDEVCMKKLFKEYYDKLNPIFKNPGITSAKYDFNAKVFTNVVTNKSEVLFIKDWMFIK